MTCTSWKLNLRVQFSRFLPVEEGWIGLKTGNRVKTVLIALEVVNFLHGKRWTSLNFSHVESARF